MNLLTVWIEIEVKTIKWVEVKAPSVEYALKNYTPQQGTTVTRVVAFKPKEIKSDERE